MSAGPPSEDAPPTPVTLRPETPDDETLLRRLYASTREEEFALTGWDEAQRTTFLDMQFTAQRHSYRQQFPDAERLVIERGGEAIGRLYVDRSNDEMRIVDIALLPEHRGAGIGGALLRGVLDEAAAAGKPVSLHVGSSNPARRLYERCGFAALEDDGLHVRMEWRPPD